jgi:hypothetical protein
MIKSNNHCTRIFLRCAIAPRLVPSCYAIRIQVAMHLDASLQRSIHPSLCLQVPSRILTVVKCLQLEEKCDVLTDKCSKSATMTEEWHSRCLELTDISRELAQEADTIRAEMATEVDRAQELEAKLEEVSVQVPLPCSTCRCTVCDVLHPPNSVKSSHQHINWMMRSTCVTVAMQRDAEVAALKEEIHQLHKQTEEAKLAAEETADQFAAWRQVQADLVHTLPHSQDTATRAGVADPELGSIVPKHAVLRFNQGAESPLAALGQSMQHRESPLEIFRQVYSNDRKPSKQQECHHLDSRALRTGPPYRGHHATADLHL